MSYIEAIAEGALPIRQQDLAAKAGVNRVRIAEWRRNGRFNEWMGAKLNGYVAQTWPAIKAVAVRMAMRGSIDHMKFLAALLEPAVRGLHDPVSPASAGMFAGAIIVNVPQPPAELAGHIIVRGLLEQAQTFEATTTPAT